MLLLPSVRSPYKINQPPCSGIMSGFLWLRDGLLIRRAGVDKGVSVEPGWGLNFEDDDDPSATPSLETQTQHSKCLVQSRFMPCPKQLRGALEWGCPCSPGGMFALQELVGIISPDRQLLNLVFPECWGCIWDCCVYVSECEWMAFGRRTSPLCPRHQPGQNLGFFTYSS